MKIDHLLLILPILMLTACGTKTNKKSIDSSTTKRLASTGVDYSGTYSIHDKEFGTNTKMTLQNGNRIMQTNGLPNHETGDFPNPGNPNTISTQEKTYTFPIVPKLSGASKWAREPGIAVNGIKFEPETAERFVCETGEQYKIEAIQDLVNLGLDFNNAHVQPTGAYHYHGVPKELIKLLDTGEDIILVGYAKDGFPMYYSKSGKYKPSFRLANELRTGDVCTYNTRKQTIAKALDRTDPDGTFVSDWDYVAGLGDLDECNGITINDQYGYFITDEYPYVGRCLKGVFEERRPKGPRPEGSHRHGKGPLHNH